MKSIALLALIALTATSNATIFTPPTNSPNATIQLAWNPSPDTNVTGYCLYQGTATTVYTNKVSVGNVTNFTVIVPRSGATYFWTVTATDGTQESDPSNEVNYRPAPVLAPPGGFLAPIRLAVQTKLPSSKTWADAGMDWVLDPVQANQQFRLTIASATSLATAQARAISAASRLPMPPAPGAQ